MRLLRPADESGGAELRRLIARLDQLRPGQLRPGVAEASPVPPDLAGMARAYADRLGAVLDAPGHGLTEPQVEALRRVDALLDDMDDPETPELWEKTAASDHPMWGYVDRLASEAVHALGVSADDPAS